MKKLFLIAFLLPVLAASCKRAGTETDEGPSIVIHNTTNPNVIEKNKSRAVGDDYWLTITSNVGYTADRVLGTGRVIKNLEEGVYTVTLTSQHEYTLPAYSLPVYSGSDTKLVSGGTLFSITCTQINTGVRFIFDESVTGSYPDVVATITTAGGQSLNFDPDNETAGDIAYFDPGKLTITLTNNSNTVLIGGAASQELNVNARELWTVTLKTSNSGNNIQMEIHVDETVTEQTPEFGVGEVKGRGTADDPFSVAGAINAMPAYGVWVEGYILGSTTLDFTRAGGEDNLVIGLTPTTPIEMGIALNVNVDRDLREEFELPEGADLKGMLVAVKGNVVGKADYYKSPTLAVITNIQRWTPNYFSDLNKSVNYYAINTLHNDGIVLKNADVTGSEKLKIGACVRHEQLIGGDQEDAVYTNILKRDFNSVTAEYTMKMEWIWRNKSDYPAGNFTDADKLVKFARDNGMRVHGHTLIWSEVVPRWLKTEGASWTSEQWTEVMETYIKNVITHYTANYPGVVASWDVVNEAFRNEDGKLWGETATGDNSFWYDKVGPDFIEKAFRAARKALDDAGDSQCKLFYNDYGIVSNMTKRNGIYDYFAAALLKTGEDAVPIDGIGMQCHIDVFPDHKQAQASFAKMAGLQHADGTKLLIHLSELDALINNPAYINGSNGGVYFTKWWEGANATNFWAPDFAQGKSFNMMARAYLDNVPEAQQFGISTWGITDRYSLTNGNHYEGKPDWGVLFTKANQPKSAYHGLLEALLGIDWQKMESGEDGGYGYGWEWRWKVPGGYSQAPNYTR